MTPTQLRGAFWKAHSKNKNLARRFLAVRELEQENARLSEVVSDMRAVICEVLGMLQVDCMDDKSNSYRSVMIDMERIIAQATGETTP